MRYIFSIGLLFAMGVIFVLSCQKYKDPPATTDPRLTNPYCNDPTAVNYNWGFPGKPDSTVCFYPTDVFQGVYEYHDSVFIPPSALFPSGLFIYADTFLMTIKKISNTKISVTGFCSNNSAFLLTASPLYVATLDTTMGDTTTINRGQMFCDARDTVSGTFTKDRLNDSILYINLIVASDTGVISNHIGTAYKK